MRTHVELDAGVEMRSFDALEQLRRDYAWAIDIQLCVFPQEGLTNNPRSEQLLIEALRRGAPVIGAAPNYDPDKNGQIRRIFELAREFDTDIDMHLDSGSSTHDMDIHLVCELTKRYGLGGRVAVGHGCKYASLPPPDLLALAGEIADAGVAVTVLPATDLYMMGRDQDHSVRRGVADANLLVENGVNCSISSNNILNPFTPLGDGNLIRIANLQANVCQIGEPGRLRECFAMLTDRSARLMNLHDYGIAVGNPADIVIFDATTPEEAVAEVQPPLVVFKRGVHTVTRPRAELHGHETIRHRAGDPQQECRPKAPDARHHVRLRRRLPARRPVAGAGCREHRPLVPRAAGSGDSHPVPGRPGDQDRHAPHHHGRRSGRLDVYGAQQHAPLLGIEI